MKKIFVLLLFTLNYSYSQIDSISSIYPNIDSKIVKLDSISDEVIYNKIKSWIQTYYKNPNIVLKGDIKNEMVRIEGVSYFIYNWMGKQTAPMYYTLEVNIKDNKYKFDYLSVRLFDDKKQISYLYDNKGHLKKQRYIKDMYESILNNLNELHFGIYKYITNNNKNDW
ncbi:DUF4468 domain-containing protein [Flavobacterium sp. LMO6]|uniref:DUF4468 domain-containing protein n=1 Tax=Flavobacterium phage vB_FspS_laban6-1 TaxID=2686250 RepID=A0A6B9LC49_9CAUD|nr:DUF4468 domain-containing protein [Flavobacterium sp. LMO6]YP_009854810.1 DUF4468 domain-containing protein [Flavobacterium phage vB_FspS_laban6-1]MQP63340.1 DUF4468 domain-containing protein [Flavobacterium sp. LMO6]QHB38983.1 hypothetical protein laban61_gp012 [Flavobacterium phage vB_FspS_laban6-1]